MSGFSTRLRCLAGTATALACATAIGLAAPSTARPVNDAFLDRLDDVGITYTNRVGPVVYAHKVCRELDLGVPHSRVVDLVRYDSPAFDWKTAADFVVLAYMTYCPWNRQA